MLPGEIWLIRIMELWCLFGICQGLLGAYRDHIQQQILLAQQQAMIAQQQQVNPQTVSPYEQAQMNRGLPEHRTLGQ